MNSSQSDNLAGSPQEMNLDAVVPLAEWHKEEENELKLADEISENELKEFALGCIESLASVAQSGSQAIEQVLTKVVSAKLISFVDLAQESEDAKREFKKYFSWSKQFISSVQPLLSSSSAPNQEVGQLNSQVIQCVERSVCQKYRSETLALRVSFLVRAISDYVAKVGVEMGLPKSVMDKVGKSVNRVLVGMR